MWTLRQCITAIDKINMFIAKVVSWAVLLIIGATIYEVVMRYVFTEPTKWVFEFNYLLHGVYFMLLGAYTFAVGGHVKVDIVQNHFSPRTRAFVDLITSPIVFIFLILMIWYGGVFAINSFGFRETLSTAWAPPVWPIKMVIPIAATMVALQAVAKFIRDLHLAVTGRDIDA